MKIIITMIFICMFLVGFNEKIPLSKKKKDRIIYTMLIITFCATICVGIFHL